MKHLLFICSQNKLRSPTAEQVFSGMDGIEVMSAGLDPTAASPLCSEILEWADVIFVMEKTHRNKLQKKFRAFLKNQRLICLNIPDEYDYMEPALVELLKARVGPYLRTIS